MLNGVAHPADVVVHAFGQVATDWRVPEPAGRLLPRVGLQPAGVWEPSACLAAWTFTRRLRRGLALTMARKATVLAADFRGRSTKVDGPH